MRDTWAALVGAFVGRPCTPEDEANVPNVSFYCFSLMLPFGYEPGLLKEQRHLCVVCVRACRSRYAVVGIFHMTLAALDSCQVTSITALPQCLGEEVMAFLRASCT